MSGSSFRSVFMVASCAGAALGCYLVSLRVASERAALEEVETEIVMAQRDIRLLQTEIGTRGRLAQLERWNVKVLALSAPAADQFLEGGFALARLAKPTQPDALEAPVVLAAAPAPPAALDEAADGAAPKAAPRAPGVTARDLLHVASLKTEPRPSSRMTIDLTRKPMPAAKAPAPKLAATVKALTPAPKKIAAVVDPMPKTVKPTKPSKAAADPLAPLPVSSKTAKESGKAQ